MLFTIAEFIAANPDLKLNHKSAAKLLRERGYVVGWARRRDKGDYQSGRCWGRPEEFGRPTAETPINIPGKE